MLEWAGSLTGVGGRSGESSPTAFVSLKGIHGLLEEFRATRRTAGVLRPECAPASLEDPREHRSWGSSPGISQAVGLGGDQQLPSCGSRNYTLKNTAWGKSQQVSVGPIKATLRTASLVVVAVKD